MEPATQDAEPSITEPSIVGPSLAEPAGEQFVVRNLTVADLERCMALAIDRDWPAEERKWRLLLDLGAGYGLENEAGDLIASAVLTRYGGQVGAISMVLVAARYGRRGLGSRLMRHVLAVAGVPTLVLTATDHGRPVYERLGFQTAGGMTTHWGDYCPSGAERPVSRPAMPADRAGIIAADRAAFGADRTELITRLTTGFADQVRVVERAGQVVGYATAWRNGPSTLIGPVIAPDLATARGLIVDLAAGITGPIRLDLDDRDAELAGWAAARGLTPTTRTAQMVYGAPVTGHRNRLFVPVMQALG